MGTRGIWSGNIKLGGLAEHVRKLNEDIKKTGAVTKGGLIKAGLLIQRESQKQVPVDKGNLKAGAYTQYEDTPQGPRVAIGYIAVYSVVQHEEMGFEHKVGKAKYLEDPLHENSEKVLLILQEENRKG